MAAQNAAADCTAIGEGGGAAPNADVLQTLKEEPSGLNVASVWFGCAAPGREGLAGWTWYTGSAGWYYRALTEGLLGLRLEGGHLRASSGALASYRVRWTDGEGAVHEIVKKDGAVYVDGVKQEG